MKKKKDRIEELLREYYTSRRKPGEDEEYRRFLIPMAKQVRSPISCDAKIPGEGQSPVPEASSTGSEKKNCPSLEDLAAFIEGVIDKKMSIFIEDHLAFCPDCSEKYRTASDTIDRHRRGKSERTPEDLSEETSSRLEELYHESQSSPEDEEDL
ncbi:MAG: hypothetical protein ACE5OP_13405 [Candidatus Glassbacteria bacterium]